ncbi:hypothetical protein HMPREF0080_01526, partial [Anaeroglobus geminatus F0357]
GRFCEHDFSGGRSGVFPYTFTGCMPRCNARINFNTEPVLFRRVLA